MLTVKACSVTTLLGEWSKQDFHSLQFQKNIGSDNHHLFKCLTLDVDSRNGIKSWEKALSFSENSFELEVTNPHNVERDT